MWAVAERRDTIIQETSSGFKIPNLQNCSTRPKHLSLANTPTELQLLFSGCQFFPYG
jgi:hypothetical protein